MPYNVRESAIEKYLVEQIAELRGEAYKFTSPGRRAVLDRLCVLPYGVIAFVEVKAPGKRPSDAQVREMQRLSRKGHIATYVDSVAGVNELIEQLTEVLYERFRDSKRIKKDSELKREEKDSPGEQPVISEDSGSDV